MNQMLKLRDMTKSTLEKNTDIYLKHYTNKSLCEDLINTVTYKLKIFSFKMCQLFYFSSNNFTA